MTFIYDTTPLPPAKTDRDTPTDQNRQCTAFDWNTVFTALGEIREDFRDRVFNVRSFGAEVDNSTDDATAILDAIDAAQATVNGAFGAAVLIPKGITLSSEKIVTPNGVALIGAGGPGGPVSGIKAHPTFNDTALITNELHDGTQEYAFLHGLRIIGNKGAGAVCSVAVVDFVSLFVNSEIVNCIIEEGSNVGLRIAAEGTPGGMGPIRVVNCWVARNTGHNVYVEDAAGNSGAATNIVFDTLTTENQGTNKSAIYLKGNGRLAGIRFIGCTHIEMGSLSFTGKTGVTFDGCAHTAFENLTILGSLATINEGVNILNVVQNVGITLEHIYNPNLITPVIRDQKSGVTVANPTYNVNHYNTSDWTYLGGPKYQAASGGKSIVFQSSAGVDRAWLDDAGRVTGNSVNGAGLDVKGDETNNRTIMDVPNTTSGLTNIYGRYYPSGGGGVIRERSFTGAADVRQIGTDASEFHYEAQTFQKTATFQQGIRLQAEISPPQITANQNNYSPTGLSTTTTMFLTSDASRDITGIAAQSSGVLWVYNIGAQNIVLKHQDANSTAANRIIGTAGADVTLTPNRCAMLRYSASQTRWLVMTDNL